MEQRSSFHQFFNDTHQTNLRVFVFDDYIQRIVIALIFSVICIVGLIGNFVVILSIVLSRKLRSTTNWFVINLACADVLASLCLPFHVVTILDKTDALVPSWLCTSVAVVRLTCLSESLLMLTMIGFTRWYLITKPMHKFKKLNKRRNIIIFMVSTWVYSVIWVIIPHFTGLGTLGFSFHFKVCQWDTRSKPFRDFYSLLGGFGVFVVFVAVVINYALIYRFVARHDRKMKEVRQGTVQQTDSCPGHGANLDEISSGNQSFSVQMKENNQTCIIEQSQRAEALPAPGEGRQPKMERVIKKQTVVVTKRLAVIVFAFFFCFMPFGVSILVTPLQPLVPWTLPIFHLSNCINPLIYARTMPSFGKVMKDIILCRCNGNM